MAKMNERLASRAVDGSSDRSYQQCAFPHGMRGTLSWWKVDFEETYKINRVIIYNSNKRE